jgi:O-methyltransferase
MKSSLTNSESGLTAAVLTEQAEPLSPAWQDEATEKPGSTGAPASVPGTLVNKENTLMRVVLGICRRLAYWFAVPVILTEYFQAQTGREYGIGFFTKVKLALKMRRNYGRITTGSRVIEHLLMATQIMRVPKAVEGCVVECGSFKGGSATNLSLVCALCDRQMEIFDSFAGLPEPTAVDAEHLLVTVRQVHTYAKGAWKGALEEVKGNITRFGDVERCNFNVGYFDESLPKFQNRKVVFAFLDVDLRTSLETCLMYLWPQLQDSCYIFTHEAPHMEIASVFFAEDWWRSTANSKAPGLVGAGSGLGLLPASGGFRSDLGYTVKNPSLSDFVVNPQTGVF